MEGYEKDNTLIQELLTLRLKVTESLNKNDSGRLSQIIPLPYWVASLLPDLSHGVVTALLSLSYSTALFFLTLVLNVLANDALQTRVSVLNVFLTICLIGLLALPSTRISSLAFISFWSLFIASMSLLLNIIAGITNEVMSSLAANSASSNASERLSILQNVVMQYLMDHLTLSSLISSLWALALNFARRWFGQLIYLWTAIVSFEGNGHSFAIGAAGVTATLGVILFSMEKRAQRAVYIYWLGCGLIGFYASTQIICKVLRLSEASRTDIYESIDSFVAPFITHEIGQLRSIFVKFAQYMGARSDVVSSVWTNSLSKLQDACPHSSAEYVRTCIEKEFGKSMEELFLSFNMTPIASASIAQVHLATVHPSYFEQSRSEAHETDACFDMHANPAAAEGLDSAHGVSVIVKVQHEDVKAIMVADMVIAIRIAKLAAQVDDRWDVSPSFAQCSLLKVFHWSPCL